MAAVTLQLHGTLPGLARGSNDGVVRVPVPHPRAVKDAIESVGIPHTEVAAVEVDGAVVDLAHHLTGGEDVVVHDVLAAPDVGTPAQPPLHRPVRFVADVHLGTLARRLRLLGFDTWYRTHAEDGRLARVSATQGRVLLSRDRGLLSRRRVRHGALIRHDDPTDQLDQVLARFDLVDAVREGTRCPRCNGSLRPVDRSEVADRIPPGTRAADYTAFRVCGDCGQVYWPGAHAPALRAIVERATS